MVLLPEEAEMTLAELRQMAACQQQQIEGQQQLLISKEQRLKFLKQQESRYHHLTDLKVDPKCLQSLRERVKTQELKLDHLRALHGQVEQQRTNNSNLGDELKSIRALFTEKEKELGLAVNKVEELTRQLDEVRCNKTHKKPQISPLLSQLENLKKELVFRNKISDEQNTQISKQQNVIMQRQQDIFELDDKIAELTQRLQRKQFMNQQLANQMRNASKPRQPIISSHVNNFVNFNVAAVEPMQREPQEPDHTQDDIAAKLRGSQEEDLSEFSLKKNDPKYQTLPYNTKFVLKGNACDGDNHTHSEDSSSSSDNSLEPNSLPVAPKPTIGIINFTARPFGSNYNNTSVARVIGHHVEQSTETATQNVPAVLPKPVVPSGIQKSEKKYVVNSNHVSSTHETDSANKPRFLPRSTAEQPVGAKLQKEKTFLSKTSSAKPVVPPKPTLPVKPIPPPRQTPTKDRNNSDERNINVSMALSVLQSKSAGDKSAFRYTLQNNANAERPRHEQKVQTYFPKAAGSSELKNSEPLRRKTSTSQLPIKPKPLTIRKTPGIEAPKLKVSQIYSNTAYKKPQESSSKTVSLSTSSQLNAPIENSNVPKLDVISNQFSALSIPANCESSELFDSLESDKGDETPVEGQDGNDIKTYELPEDEDSSSPCDSLECVPVFDSCNLLKITTTTSEKESVHQNAAFLCVKGNLKTESSVRNHRRVSFDPLALLLDAALEGELELVKKTAGEVTNPSAANDEGITALHNAICAGHYDVVTFLVDFGCDVNAQDSDGWTPLHCAASCNNLPMVKFLVEKGACIYATTLSDHETAAEKCEEEEEGFDGCSEYLYGLQENMGIVNDGHAYAVYDYTGLNADELSFKDGDSLRVLRNGDDQESEWWWSKLADEEGYVPRNLLGLFPRIPMKKD